VNRRDTHFAGFLVDLHSLNYLWSTRMTILIVGDDASIRQLLTVFLTYKDYHSVAVANGAEALSYLQDLDQFPQLILLDLMMPAMDGAAFRQAQQQDPRLAPIPVVLMSAMENIEEQAPRLQVSASVPKPVDFEVLLSVVEQHCKQSQQRGV
jgi:CheY-like chemotaxis protein